MKKVVESRSDKADAGPHTGVRQVVGCQVLRLKFIVKRLWVTGIWQNFMVLGQSIYNVRSEEIYEGLLRILCLNQLKTNSEFGEANLALPIPTKWIYGICPNPLPKQELLKCRGC
jgi:hypothetical protein